jgi:tetratricopeptide (TPR) repeat protein
VGRRFAILLLAFAATVAPAADDAADRRARYAEASRLYEQGQYAAAIQEAKKLLEGVPEPTYGLPISPFAASAAWLISQCHFAAGDYEQALAATRFASTRLRRQSGCGTCAMSISLAYRRQEALCLDYLGRYAEAVPIYFAASSAGFMGGDAGMASRLVDLYKAAGQMHDLLRMLDAEDRRFEATLAGEIPAVQRERFEKYRPTKLVRRVIQIRQWGATKRWDKLLPLLRITGTGSGPNEAHSRRAHWEAVEAARALATSPAETTSLLLPIRDQPGRGHWVYYALGLCGTEDAVAALVARAKADDNWYNAIAIVYCLHLAGDRGRQALDDLAPGAGANLAAALRQWRENKFDKDPVREPPFPPIRGRPHLPRTLPAAARGE